jgi:hypothetical protein
MPLARHLPAPTALPPGRWRAALLLVALVLLVHAGLLGLWPSVAGPGGPGAAARTMQVRQIVQAAAAVPTAAAGPAPLTTPTAPYTSAPSTALGLAPAPARPVSVARRPAAAPADTAPAESVLRPATAADHTAPLTTEAITSPAPQEIGGSALPVYAAHLPPPFTLHYLRQRGAQQGHAELRWEVQGDQYQLSLNSLAGAGPALGSSSRGGIGEHGLAPERHTESRRGRDVRAANFQRESARITFSGPRTEYPLLPGSQDRLSWIVQLPAILQAQPALQAIGSETTMFVVGSRGDGETWIFTVQGSEDLDLPVGRVTGALHLKREARRPYDTQAEIWLDPARQHLPVRLRLLVQPTGEGTDFLLESVTAP